MFLPEPYSLVNSVNCLAEHADATTCDWDLIHHEGFPFVQRAYEHLQEKARDDEKLPQIWVLDASDIVCPDGRCHALTNGRPLFHDYHHVNRRQILHVAPAILEMIRAAGVPW